MLITPAPRLALNVTRAQFNLRVNTLVARIAQDDSLVLLACIRLYAFQTQDEKRIDATVHDNGAEGEVGELVAVLAGHAAQARHVVGVHHLAVVEDAGHAPAELGVHVLEAHEEQRKREDVILAAITSAA